MKMTRRKFVAASGAFAVMPAFAEEFAFRGIIRMDTS